MKFMNITKMNNFYSIAYYVKFRYLIRKKFECYVKRSIYILHVKKISKFSN